MLLLCNLINRRQKENTVKTQSWAWQCTYRKQSNAFCCRFFKKPNDDSWLNSLVDKIATNGQIFEQKQLIPFCSQLIAHQTMSSNGMAEHTVRITTEQQPAKDKTAREIYGCNQIKFWAAAELISSTQQSDQQYYVLNMRQPASASIRVTDISFCVVVLIRKREKNLHETRSILLSHQAFSQSPH